MQQCHSSMYLQASMNSKVIRVGVCVSYVWAARHCRSVVLLCGRVREAVLDRCTSLLTLPPCLHLEAAASPPDSGLYLATRLQGLLWRVHSVGSGNCVAYSERTRHIGHGGARWVLPAVVGCFGPCSCASFLRCWSALVGRLSVLECAF